MTESLEMYLETLLILKKRLGTVRSVDIAREMNFSKPSVSRAIDRLREMVMVRVDERNGIHFTKKGLAVAKKIYERHVVLSYLLRKMGVPKEIADADACAMEHVISDETFDIIRARYNAIREAQTKKEASA